MQLYLNIKNMQKSYLKWYQQSTMHIERNNLFNTLRFVYNIFPLMPIVK